MCQYSGPDQGDNNTIEKRMEPSTSLSNSPSPTMRNNPPSPSSPPGVPRANKLCATRRWRTTLYTTSQEFSAKQAAFTEHIDNLKAKQTRMDRLARRCTRARLYPNPRLNAKSSLKGQLDELTTDMDFCSRLNNMYSAALMLYRIPVQAVINELKVPGMQCQCSECMGRSRQWATNTHAEIEMEANGLLGKIQEMRTQYVEVERGVLMAWKKKALDELRKMIDALPENEEMKGMQLVRKYFPRQIREMQEEDGASEVVVRRVGSGDVDARADSVCEMSE